MVLLKQIDGTVDLGAVDNAVLDSIASFLIGTLTVTGTILSAVCGAQANANHATTLTGSGTYDYKTGVDAQYCAKISAYGSMTPDTEITVKLQQSQDNSNWYDCGVSYVSSGTSLQDFFMSLPDAGSRYYRLGFAETNATPSLTSCVGTIAGKTTNFYCAIYNKNVSMCFGKRTIY